MDVAAAPPDHHTHRRSRRPSHGDIGGDPQRGFAGGCRFPIGAHPRIGHHGVTEDAISIGGVDLADPDTYGSGMPFDAFRKLRECAPAAWHPHKDGPGFLARTGYDEVFAVSRGSATWSSEATAVYFDVPGPDDIADERGVMMMTMGPPRHTALRALVSKGFTPRQVASSTNASRTWRATWSTASSSGACATSSQTSSVRCPHTSSPNCSAFPWRPATG